MRDVAEWIRDTLASRREAKQRAAAILFVGSTTELSPGAALLASEPDLPRLPVAEDGDITPYTRPLRQARLRLKEFATEARRGDFRAVEEA